MASEAVWAPLAPRYCSDAGKTILCSTTIESAIAKHTKDPDTVVCYFDFDSRDPEKQTTLGFLLPILHQLCVNLPSVPDELLGIYDEYKGDEVRPSSTGLFRHLIFVIRRYQVGGRYHTAVIAAAAFGHKDVIKQLLDAKADPFADGSKFGTAVQAAKVNGRDDVALLLEEHIKSIQVATLPSTRSCEPTVKMPMKLTFTVKL